MSKPLAYSHIMSLRSFHRPIGEGEKILENWHSVVERVIQHQRWLWERALNRPINEKEEDELDELKALIVGRYLIPAPRTLWLAATEIARTRESSLFSTAFTHIETVYDLVDLFWLMLQGLSVGFRPIRGTLSGFRRPLNEIQIIRSNRTSKGGLEHNIEKFDIESGTWTIKVGDSAVAWAKAVGKLIAGKYPAKTLVLDFSEIRPSGSTLKGYGWISSGDEAIAQAFKKIAKILSDRSDQLLTRIDILDIVNLLGTILAVRGTAQTAIMEYGQPEWLDFAKAKKEWWLKGLSHRQQSINSLLFREKPSKKELEELFAIILETGGSEPRIVNGQEAEKRSPWFKGVSPDGELLLGNKSFGSLVEINLVAFRGDKVGLERALYLAGRMNYRQTLVNLRDEILQEAWHYNNDFLHLGGVSLTGIQGRPDLTSYDFKRMRNITVSAAYGMAQDLGRPLPKNVTSLSSSNNLSKCLGTEGWGAISEGAHTPIGRYLFYYMPFHKNDPLIARLKTAGYQVVDKSVEPEKVFVRFPLRYEQASFTRETITRKNGKIEEVELNRESAIDQLNRYQLLQANYSEQNSSLTIHYDPAEVTHIIDWILENWDSFIGVSFALRDNILKTLEESGPNTLSQEVVSKETFEAYTQKLKPIDLTGIESAVEPEFVLTN